MSITLTAKSRLLFIGDSITDCGRGADPEGMGSGYVRLIRDWLRAKDPANAPVVINTGISGHRVTDLQARWDRDVLAHSPDVVSIKIGINDVWHGLNPTTPRGVPIELYTETYRQILKSLGNALPSCRIVLCEPSVIWPPAPAHGNDVLQPYVRSVHDLARAIKAECVVPLHAAFVKAKELRPDIVWAPDGVHPSSSGHMLIARTWLASTGLL